MYFIEMKHFCSLKNLIKRMKRQSIDWDLDLEYVMNSKNSVITEQTIHLKNGQKTRTDISSKVVQMLSTKRWSISLTTREMQIQATMRYHYTSFRTAEIKNSDSTKWWPRCRETFIHC